MQFWSVAFCCKSLMSITIRLTVLSKIYRCWTVYGHSWRIVCLPIVFWFGSLTCIALVIYTKYEYTRVTSATSAIKLLVSNRDVGIGFYCGSIATNLFSTCLIIVFCFVI